MDQQVAFDENHHGLLPMDNVSKSLAIPHRTRNTLWYLMFTGFIVDSMIRIVLTITIVDMILKKEKQNTTIVPSYVPNYTEPFSFERYFLNFLKVK